MLIAPYLFSITAAAGWHFEFPVRRTRRLGEPLERNIAAGAAAPTINPQRAPVGAAVPPAAIGAARRTTAQGTALVEPVVLTKGITKVLAGLQQMGLTYRGLYGEGSEVLGNFFQISNQTTLGRSEDELADHLGRVVRHVIQREQEARRVLLRDAGYIIEDKLWRAYGTLRHARSVTFDEAMGLLSAVRLAVGLKLITGLSVYTLNKLLIFCQAAHLAHGEGRALTEGEADIARARFVRGALADEMGPAT